MLLKNIAIGRKHTKQDQIAFENEVWRSNLTNAKYHFMYYFLDNSVVEVKTNNFILITAMIFVSPTIMQPAKK